MEWSHCLKLIPFSLNQLDDSRSDYKTGNLFVKEIIIDHNISIPYQLNSVYNVIRSDGIHRIKNNYGSYAELAKNKLLSLGIDSSLIKAIPGKKVTINRTLTSALAFRDWLRTSKKDFKGINIVTLGTHAERTWMIYDRILNKKYDIGIISMPDYRERRSNKYKVFKTIRETLGIIYYWFILIPY